MTDKNNQNNIIVHREYNIKNDENEYILRIEIDQQYMYFIVSKLNESLEYIYKSKMDLITIINKLELNSSKYTNLESILKIFDIIYEKNKIIINIIDDSCNILIKLINIFEKEVVFEIKLYKEYMSNNDKFNVLYNKIKFIYNENHGDLKIWDNMDLESIKNKLNELNTKMNKREEQIKNILNIKDNFIKEINEKLLKQENEIQKLNDKNIKEIIEKRVGEIESKLINDFNDKMNNIKNQLINDINKQNKIIEQLKDNNDENQKYQIMEEKYNKLIESIDCSKKVVKISDDNNSDTKNEEEYNSEKLMSQKNEIDSMIKDNELIKKEVKEINNKINNTDKEIKKIENSIKEKDLLVNKINEKINEKINKDNNTIKEINKKIEEINNNKKDEKGLLMNEINNKIIKNENSINVKIEEKMKDINKILENKIDTNQMNELSDNINNKYNELKLKINHNEYINKINYQFITDPINLKYKSDITYTNTNAGWNDMFEIFISYKDNKEYIISPNNTSFNLDVFELKDNKKIISLRGHRNDIRTIRYFINTKVQNINEYLISGDDDTIVIVWDITDNYKILHKIETKYGDFIYSCLILFPHNIENNYFITSTYNDSDELEKSATKIYSLNTGKLIKYIKYSNYNAVYYLLSWHNKKNNRYYIIQFSYMKIIINDLYDDEIFYEMTHEPETDHFSGFIFNREGTDYLCSSSENGFINVWDLYSKTIFKVINTNGCLLAHIIPWNDQFFIAADFNNKSFLIIDIDEDTVISLVNNKNTKEVKCIKKVYHPIYGESLLSASKDNTIKLWTM